MVSGAALQEMERQERDAALRKLETAGLSILEIARLTGIGRGVVQEE